MLKRIVALLLLVAIGLSLVACAPKECDECGVEDKKLKKVEVDGDKQWLCSECEKDAFAPAACEECGAKDEKLKKVEVDGDKQWLCPECEENAFAPDECESCGVEGEKLKKVFIKSMDEALWLCPDCQAFAELANGLYDLGF